MTFIAQPPVDFYNRPASVPIGFHQGLRFSPGKLRRQGGTAFQSVVPKNRRPALFTVHVRQTIRPGQNTRLCNHIVAAPPCFVGRHTALAIFHKPWAMGIELWICRLDCLNDWAGNYFTFRENSSVHPGLPPPSSFVLCVNISRWTISWEHSVQERVRPGHRMNTHFGQAAWTVGRSFDANGVFRLPAQRQLQNQFQCFL